MGLNLFLLLRPRAVEPVERQVTTPGHAAVLTIEDGGGMVSMIMGWGEQGRRHYVGRAHGI